MGYGKRKPAERQNGKSRDGVTCKKTITPYWRTKIYDKYNIYKYFTESFISKAHKHTRKP